MKCYFLIDGSEQCFDYYAADNDDAVRQALIGPVRDSEGNETLRLIDEDGLEVALFTVDGDGAATTHTPQDLVDFIKLLPEMPPDVFQEVKRLVGAD